jgi:acyl-CoA thioester hydrolase
MIIPIEVVFRDLDALAHVNNAVYLSYFELGRVKYWDRVAGVSQPRDIAFIVAAASINYRLPCFLGDRVALEVLVPRIGHSAFDFSYVLRRGKEAVADGSTTQVLWDWEKNERRLFSDDLRARIARVEAEDARPAGSA